MRSDAASNRVKLLVATRDCVSQHGPEVGVRAIADRAGVGVSTLYRHFPSKRDLIDGISVHRWGTMFHAARIESIRGGSYRSIVELMRTFSAMVRSDSPFIDATGIRIGRTPDAILPLKVEFDREFATLWQNAISRREISLHLRPDDLIDLVGSVRASGGKGQRELGIVLGGIRNPDL